MHYGRVNISQVLLNMLPFPPFSLLLSHLEWLSLRMVKSQGCFPILLSAGMHNIQASNSNLFCCEIILLMAQKKAHMFQLCLWKYILAITTSIWFTSIIYNEDPRHLVHFNYIHSNIYWQHNCSSLIN